MYPMPRLLLLALATSLSSSLALAQAQDPPAVVSPEIHWNRSATLRIYAPHADEVVLDGGGPLDNLPLTKGPDGVWSVTTPSLGGGIHDYKFLVDGVPTLDPRNPRTKHWAGGSSSYFGIDGIGPQPWDLRNVPHGTVHIEHYLSRGMNAVRSYRVYTPPGYAKSARRFPVLYLLHGSGDSEREWTEFGRAHLILDNLYDEGKIEPMVVVMPYGHTEYPPIRGRGSNPNASNIVVSDIVESIIPDVESKYRVLIDQRSRAVAGLSMGGSQSFIAAMRFPDRFAWVGVFSSGPRDLEQSAANLIADPKRFDRLLELFWIGCGRDDGALSRAEALDALLTKVGVEHQFVATAGDHSWPIWRDYLTRFTPLLFRE